MTFVCQKIRIKATKHFLGMGLALSQRVDFDLQLDKLCTKSHHHFHCSPHRHRAHHPHHRAPETLNQAGLLGPTTFYRWSLKDLEAARIPSMLSVLIVSKEDSDGNFTSEYPKYKRYPIDSSLLNFNNEFEDVNKNLESISDEDETRRENEKIYSFVRAWKNGLTKYPSQKIYKICTDIPLAATSQCKRGISRFKRCQRCLLRCSSAEESDYYLADLLHIDSLDRFMYETDYLQAASSIQIRQTLKRKKLYDIVKFTGQNGEEREIEGEPSALPDEEELSISIQFDLPPPVRLQHPKPEPLIQLPSEEVMHQRYDAHHQREADKLLKQETHQKEKRERYQQKHQKKHPESDVKSIGESSAKHQDKKKDPARLWGKLREHVLHKDYKKLEEPGRHQEEQHPDSNKDQHHHRDDDKHEQNKQDKQQHQPKK